MDFDGKNILITGGTGTIGTALVKRFLSEYEKINKIIIFSRDEAKQNKLRQYYWNKENATDEIIYHDYKRKLEFVIGDIRNYSDVVGVCRKADIIINAAALKQVPSCEYFPEQAILTNCLGAANIVRAINEHSLDVDLVIGISTDKACKPTTVMGETKALQERIFIKANLEKKTKFVCVRYGNVISSRESVIPLFKEQINYGGPVTLTDDRMTRFLISIDDAVNIILFAINNGLGGEIFVPIIPSFKVENIAKALIGKLPIKIIKTGIRPGEKLHEILVSEEESPNVGFMNKYYVIYPMLPELNRVNQRILYREYSSSNCIQTVEETFSFLKESGVL